MTTENLRYKILLLTHLLHTVVFYIDDHEKINFIRFIATVVNAQLQPRYLSINRRA